MPCYHPMTAYRSRSGRNPETGLWPITFNVKEGYLDKSLTVPCGKCIGCRLERSRQWAIRCVHEASLYQNNCFITLTYDDKHIPDCKADQAKVPWKEDYVLFMKKLRKRYGEGIRFFHCGEYGEQFQRPHHHACLFNFDFEDKVLWSVRNGVRLFRSDALQKLWPYGYSTIGEVTWESAAYVARYVVKKITGDKAEAHYGGRVPEYITMSRRPGIGKPWFDKYKSDVLSGDKIIVRNDLIVRPAKYYDNQYDKTNHLQMERIKRKRQKLINQTNNTPERLAVREKIKLKSFKLLKRSLENDI